MKKAQDNLWKAEVVLHEILQKIEKAENSEFKEMFLKKQNILYIDFLKDKRDLQMARIEELSNILDEKKEELKKRNIEKKSMEKLKEIKLDEYMEEMEKVEKQMNDEFALNAHNLKTMKGGE